MRLDCSFSTAQPRHWRIERDKTPSRAKLMAKKAIPIHHETGNAEHRESDPADGPKDFKGKSPHRAEVQRMHRRKEVIAQTSILAVVPSGKNVRIGSRKREDVAMREVAGRPEIDQGID